MLLGSQKAILGSQSGGTKGFRRHKTEQKKGFVNHCLRPTSGHRFLSHSEALVVVAFFEVVNHKETRKPNTSFEAYFGAIYKHNRLRMVYGNLLREKAQGRA